MSGPEPDRPGDEVAAGPVTLCRYTGAEGPALLSAVRSSLEHLRPWMPWAAEPPVPEAEAEFVRVAAADWERAQNFNYWMRETATGELVGGAGLHRRVGPDALEIGYWVRADRVRRGYASAAAAALTTAALAVRGIGRVEIHCDEANVASARVPRKLGYRLDRIEDDRVEAPGECGRSMIWLVDAGTWTARGAGDPAAGATGASRATAP